MGTGSSYDEYLSVASTLTWCRGRGRKPHTGLMSLCCHETFDGRMTEHNHTPSTKAGQPGRHNCNQMPRGRDQKKAGPGHQTGPTAGGEGATTDRETGQRGKTQDKNKGAYPHTKRSATKTKETKRSTDRSTKRTERSAKTTERPKDGRYIAACNARTPFTDMKRDLVELTAKEPSEHTERSCRLGSVT